MKKKRILVLATDYPRPDGYVACYFIHNRNRYYLDNNIEVTTINFSISKGYELDGIKVISLNEYKSNHTKDDFDLLLSHAPNLRNHLKFLKEYEDRFNKILFFFHGHEVLKHKDSYPKPYDYIKKQSPFKSLLVYLYDEFKLKILTTEFNKIREKSEFIFVSEWMKDMFFKNIKIKQVTISDKCHIIYNCVGEVFQKNNYDNEKDRKYDFITIRNIWDNSKYSIDIVNKIAYDNPQFKFCLVGRGEYFNFNKKAPNLNLINKHLNHQEILNLLNDSHVALMPTRADAQGVMMCEMATYGIPVVTSNIPVCKEVFAEVDGVTLIENDANIIKLDINNLKNNKSYVKCDKFSAKNTIEKEIELMNSIT